MCLSISEFSLSVLDKLITYEKEKYVLVENKFSRNRKWCLKILFIIFC